jgi:hypothetical protein
MAIERSELLQLLVRSCPGLRDRLVPTADNWLQEDGTISYFVVSWVLTDLVVDRFRQGDYGFADDLFALIERLLTEGSDEVKDIVATGFLEGMAHQDDLVPELWVPLTGPRARDYLRAWDQFTGVSTPGLDDAVQSDQT